MSADFNILDLRKSSPVVNLMVTSQDAGNLILASSQYILAATFLQHIHASIEVSPIYLLDFSLESTHSANNLEENRYLHPIDYLQNILHHYTSDSLYPVYGAGACFPGYADPSYYFSLTGNIFQPEVPNYEILVNHYMSTIQAINPSKYSDVLLQSVSTFLAGSPSNNSSEPMGHRTSKSKPTKITIFTPQCPARYAEAVGAIYKQIKYQSTDGSKYYLFVIICAQDESEQVDLQCALEGFIELPVSIFFVGIENDIYNYPVITQIIQEMSVAAKREFLRFIEWDNFQIILEILCKQVLQFGEYKGVTVKERMDSTKSGKSGNGGVRATLDRHKVKTDYYSKSKQDYIDFMKKSGCGLEQVEEVSTIGIPFIVNSPEVGSPLPFFNLRSMSMRSIKSKPTLGACVGCGENIMHFASLSCGCEIVCNKCAGISGCPKCKRVNN